MSKCTYIRLSDDGTTSIGCKFEAGTDSEYCLTHRTIAAANAAKPSPVKQTQTKKTLTLYQVLDRLPPLGPQLTKVDPDQPLFTEADLKTMDLLRLGLVRVVYDPQREYTKLTDVGGSLEQVGAVIARSIVHEMEPLQVTRLRSSLLGMISALTIELKRGEETSKKKAKDKIKAEVDERDSAKIKEAIEKRKTEPKTLPSGKQAEKKVKTKLSPMEKAVAALCKGGISREKAIEMLGA
jgi:hypothetical protein